VRKLGSLKLVLRLKPLFYLGMIPVLLLAAVLGNAVGREASFTAERGVDGSGLLTVIISRWIAGRDTVMIPLDDIAAVCIHSSSLDGVVPSGSSLPVDFCDLAVQRWSGPPEVFETWNPYPVESMSGLRDRQGALEAFLAVSEPGLLTFKTGGRLLSHVVAIAMLLLGLLVLRTFFADLLSVEVRWEADGISVLLRRKLPGFRPRERWIEYIHDGIVTEVGHGPAGSLEIRYRSGPPATISLPYMQPRKLIRLRLMLERILMTKMNPLQDDWVEEHSDFLPHPRKPRGTPEVWTPVDDDRSQ